jgi:hypothetical protein
MNDTNLNNAQNLIDEKGYIAQVNCVKILSIGIVVAGDDGLIRLNQTYLPKMTGQDGYLTNIEDVEFMNINELIAIGTDGDIGVYKRTDSRRRNEFAFKLLKTKISDDCLYHIEKIDPNTFVTWGEKNIQYKFVRSKDDDMEYHLVY